MSNWTQHVMVMPKGDLDQFVNEDGDLDVRNIHPTPEYQWFWGPELKPRNCAISHDRKFDFVEFLTEGRHPSKDAVAAMAQRCSGPVLWEWFDEPYSGLNGRLFLEGRCYRESTHALIGEFYDPVEDSYSAEMIIPMPGQVEDTIEVALHFANQG